MPWPDAVTLLLGTLVFVALLVGTIITVGLNAVHFESIAVTVSIALFVACIKAFLVAGFFMHLLSEKRLIYSILIMTVVFFIVLMILPVGTMHLRMSY